MQPNKTFSESTRTAIRIRRAVLVLARRLRPDLQRDGVSAVKLSVIGQLYRLSPMTPTELAAREGVKLPSLTRLIAELEEEGWIARDAHESDGRRTLLSLTASGRKRLVEAARVAAAPLAEIFSGLSAEDRAILPQVCVMLERVSDALEEKAGLAFPPFTSESAQPDSLRQA